MLEADDDFDIFLRQTLAARPEARSDTDFAARVLMTAPQRRPAVWPMVVAAIALVGVLVIGAMRVLAIEQAAAALTAATTSTTSATSEVAALLPAGGVGLLIALVWLTARSAFTLRPDEPYAAV